MAGITGGLLLLYWLIKSAKQKQSVTPEKTANFKENNGLMVSASAPLLVSPSEQQTINEFTPDKNFNDRITVRYIAGSHYI